MTIAETRHGVRTLETSHPPSYYFPRADVAMALLTASANRSVCEWKREATYFDVAIKSDIFRDVAWSYHNPPASFRLLQDYFVKTSRQHGV